MPKINKGPRKKFSNISLRTRRRIIQLQNQDAYFARNNSNQTFNLNSLPCSPRSSNQSPISDVINSPGVKNIINNNSYSETNIFDDLTTVSLNVLPAVSAKSIQNHYTNLEYIETIEIELKNWAVSCRISQCHLNALLIILRKYKGFEKLLKDSRTLLQTPIVNINQIRLVNPNGKYFHFGLTDILLKYYSSDIFQTK